MIKQLVTLGCIAIVGIGIFAFEMWGITPTSRDPDIGAGLVGLFGIGLAVLGSLGILLVLAKSWSRKNKK